MATTEQIEKIRAALAELNGALNAAKDGEEAQSGVRTLASEPSGETETREYLGNAGLAELARLVRAALDGKKDKFEEGYGLALEDGVLKVTLDTALFVVVKELPTEPTVEDEGKLHLVPMGETEEGNEYAEYLWVDGKWELMGTLHTKVDLSDYLPLSGGTLTGDLKVDASFYLKFNEQGERAYVLSCNDDGELVMTLWSELEEKWLSGSKKRTVYGDMTLNGKLNVGGRTTFDDDVYCDNGVEATGDLKVGGATTLSLTEKNDAENVVVADSTGKLYSMPVSALSGGSSGTSGGHTGACDGVYVAYVDYEGVRRICALSDWSSDLGAAQGVMVGDGAHELLLAPTEYDGTMQFGLYGTLIGGVITTTTTANAQKDYNGMLNTRALINVGIDETMAAGWCNQYAYGAVEAGDWWLPSCGELYGLIYGHKSDIDEALSAIGGTALNTSTYYWSSTQYSSRYAWYVYMYSGYTVNFSRSNYSRVRAVAAFDYEL